MEQSANEEEECGICLDALTNPIALPCNHKFCSECLNCWRSKYGVRSEDNEANTKCPLCREKIPPTKEMLSRLRCLQNIKSAKEARGDFSSDSYMTAKSQVEKLEREIGDWTETIDYSGNERKCLVLPDDIVKAAHSNDIQKILNWLGPLPVDKQRLNAKNPDWMDFTLVHFAVMRNNSDLLSILLQLGADVDPVAASGGTPLAGAGTSAAEWNAQARLLLEWGAEISNNATQSKDEFIEKALRSNSKLANLLKSEFGGRRCEVINLPKHPDLIGKTCVVEKYLPNKGRYKVIFETSKEVGLVGPENLKRRDRTPDDCGYYISYKNGRYTRHDFASKEECQTFVASMAEDKKSGDEDAEAESRAKQAAASLLAELDIESSADAKTKGKKKSKKKGRK